jgi:hypothetical protein
MITLEYLRGVDHSERFDVPQPEAYPHELQHPTRYSVRDVPANDTITVVLQDFQAV